MPYTGKDFTATDPGAVETYSFDFVNDLGAGESIAGASFDCAAVDGDDAAAASRLQGAALVTGSIASQQVAGLLAGVLYRLQCAATTNLGDVLILYSHVRCKDPQ